MENGDIKRNEIIKTRHPNIVLGVISGKRSWGLWVDQWCDGIVECNFTLEEILKVFKDNNIIIPDSLMKDFENRINKKKIIRNKKYLEKMNQ